MHKATIFFAVDFTLLVLSVSVAHAQTDAASVPAQPQPYTPQVVGPDENSVAIPRVSAGSTVPTGPGGPQVTYQLPVPPPPYAPAFGVPNNGQAQVNMPQATPWTPPPQSNSDVQQRVEQREKKISAVLNSWIGSDINDLIMKWGSPNGEYKMPNGNIIYTWRDERALPAPVDLSPVGDSLVGIGGGAIIISCTTSIYTDPHGKIFNWKWKGNGC